MTTDVYIRLREFLDKLPGGFPETPTGVEIRILKKMFDPEQAELTLQLSGEPETPAQIASRTGRHEADLTQKLEEMARNGLIFRIREENEKRYQAYQFVVGLYEFQLNRLDKEFCELFEEYMPYVGIAMAKVGLSQLRVVPVASSLKNDPQVAPYNRVREMIPEQDTLSVTRCICKKEQEILGHPCQKPQEVCLMFGKFARFYIDNGNARQITREEAFQILDVAEENGLVLTPTNSQSIAALCCCCSCCCPTLKNITLFPNPGEMVMSYYRSVIDGQLCTGCGECIGICPMDAVKERDGICELLPQRCIGCGLCVNRCPVEAISMVLREDRKMPPPPKTFDETIHQIAAKRGLH